MPTTILPNSYIIDMFLSAWAWLILAMLYPSVVNLTQKLNDNMDKATFQAVFSMVFKSSLVFAMPFMLVFIFLLWRFEALMGYTDTLGVGGIGLLVIMAVAGLGMIWLKTLLTLMTQGFFSSPKETPKEPFAQNSYPQNSYSKNSHARPLYNGEPL